MVGGCGPTFMTSFVWGITGWAGGGTAEARNWVGLIAESLARGMGGHKHWVLRRQARAQGSMAPCCPPPPAGPVLHRDLCHGSQHARPHRCFHRAAQVGRRAVPLGGQRGVHPGVCVYVFLHLYVCGGGEGQFSTGAARGEGGAGQPLAGCPRGVHVHPLCTRAESHPRRAAGSVCAPRR